MGAWIGFGPAVFGRQKMSGFISSLVVLQLLYQSFFISGAITSPRVDKEPVPVNDTDDDGRR